MNVKNEKIQTPNEWRTQEKHWYSYFRYGFNWLRLPSRNGQRQPIALNRTDWTRGNSCSDSLSAITGGIIEQLINEVETELATTETRANQLRDKIQLLKTLGASLDK